MIKQQAPSMRYHSMVMPDIGMRLSCLTRQKEPKSLMLNNPL